MINRGRYHGSLLNNVIVKMKLNNAMKMYCSTLTLDVTWIVGFADSSVLIFISTFIGTPSPPDIYRVPRENFADIL